MPQNGLSKILFRFYSEILEEDTSEILLASEADPEHGYYRLESIPLYASHFAVGDIFWAEYSDAEGMLSYRKTVIHSGNSTIHAVLLDDGFSIDAIKDLFEEMGCGAEKVNNYLALNIPAAIDYLSIKPQLDELEKEKVIDYAESHLSDRHQYRDISFGWE